ncbi:20728_t:CDS:2 [Gigaspora margarita]|uniref:20728_t:CDS:1 n=1 Tax=Gigaspora margarita TaxID=4874 RepID=A0ABN7VZS5_GIGMA|nr:20728_t:CDS:2 [Gigaspora margarita]
MGVVKAFCTCNVCQVRVIELQNARKRQLEIKENVNHENTVQEDQENKNDLELIELANLRNTSLFNFQCAINLLMFDKSTKEIVEELVESIENTDEFTWIYDLVKTESVNIEDNVLYSNIEDDLNKNSNELYDELITLTTKALNLLEEQKAASNS